MKWTATFFVAIGIVVIVNAPALAQDHEWWILEQGAWRWYTDALDPAGELNISATNGGPGMTNLRFDYYQNGEIAASDTLLLSADPTGDYWWRATNGDYFRSADNHDISNPILIVDEPLWVGKAWSDTIYHPYWEFDMLYELECVDETDLEVPAGTFHSFEIRYDIYYGTNLNFHFVERKWHCDGVGLVKFILEDYPPDPTLSGEYELTSLYIPGISSAETAPSATMPLRVHPNPFNPRTTIYFSLARTQWAEVSVLDLTGRRVDVVASREFEAGSHSLNWGGLDAAGRALPSGTYIVRLETEDGVEARKVSLIR